MSTLSRVNTQRPVANRGLANVNESTKRNLLIVGCILVVILALTVVVRTASKPGETVQAPGTAPVKSVGIGAHETSDGKSR